MESHDLQPCQSSTGDNQATRHLHKHLAAMQALIQWGEVEASPFLCCAHATG